MLTGVAAALELKATRFWTFDDRQAKLAEAEGLATAYPPASSQESHSDSNRDSRHSPASEIGPIIRPESKQGSTAARCLFPDTGN